MQKQAPTVGRMLVMVGFALSCFGLLLFLWLAFGGPIPLKPKGYRFDVSFGEATQLAVEADVRISGVPVGKVKTIEPDKKTGRSNATIEMEERFAPIPKDSQAVLRQKTLLGETYVELTPGDKNGEMVPEDGSLATSRVSQTVELDEIFRAFDPSTRKAFQTWMQEQADATRGRARDISDIIGNLDPFAEDTTKLLRILRSQDDAVRQTVRNTGVVFDALSERRGQLQGLIRNANTVFETTAQRDQELQEIFRIFPTFNRESQRTITRLTQFAEDTDPLITQLRPAARELSPTLRDLSALAPDLKALFRDLRPLIRASREGLPAVRQFLDDLGPALGEFDPLLKQLNPIGNFLGEYKDNVRAFFANVPATTQAVTPDGVHYLRTANPQNPENFAVYPRRIGSNRTNPYIMPRGYLDVGNGGIKSYETRHCRAGQPTIDQTQQELADALGETLGSLFESAPTDDPFAAPPATPESLAGNILEFGFNNAGREVPAPPCIPQAPFRLAEGEFVASGGNLSLFPQVREASSGSSNPDED